MRLTTDKKEKIKNIVFILPEYILYQVQLNIIYEKLVMKESLITYKFLDNNNYRGFGKSILPRMVKCPYLG